MAVLASENAAEVDDAYSTLIFVSSDDTLSINVFKISSVL